MVRSTEPKILQLIDEDFAAKLRVGNNISASIVMFTMRVNNGVAEILLVNEYSTFDWDSKWKSPAGKMLPGESWEDTIKRKLPLETGLSAKSSKFCFGAEFSSTRSERHFKIFILIPEFEGELSENTDGKISKREWKSVCETERKINRAQQFALSHIIETAKSLNLEFGKALMNNY